MGERKRRDVEGVNRVWNRHAKLGRRPGGAEEAVLAVVGWGWAVSWARFVSFEDGGCCILGGEKKKGRGVSANVGGLRALCLLGKVRL